MTYYCTLRLSNCAQGGYEVHFPDYEGVLTQGNDKEHALKMAKEAIELALEIELDAENELTENGDVTLPADRNHQGLFAIVINDDLARRILESKMKKLKKALDSGDLFKSDDESLNTPKKNINIMYTDPDKE